jgi:hypothetical protein
MITATCTGVARSHYKGRECLRITASHDDRGEPAARPPTDARSLEAIKANLVAAGCTLGGARKARSTRQPPRPTARDKCLTPPVSVFVDMNSARKQLVAEAIEVLQLSVGSTLFWLYVFDLTDELQWVIGKRLELVDGGAPSASWKTGA